MISRPSRESPAMPADPLILTLKLDATTFAVLDGLRQAHFPAERNFLPAHVTLFHALPDRADVRDVLAAACAGVPAMPLTFPKVRFFGRGVAVDVDAPELLRLRKRLAEAWAADLTPQDRQPYKPHVTVQNKVSPEAARELFVRLSAAWSPLAGCGEGLLLWHYRGGPWELAEEFAFR